MNAEPYVVKTRDILDQDIKKTTLEIPAEMHRELKKLSVIEDISMRELFIEAYYNYIRPKYMKEVK